MPDSPLSRYTPTEAKLSSEDLHRLALEGAKLTLARIYATFPALRGDSIAPSTIAPAPAPRATGRRMTAAQKAAVSKRMKAYWKARRSAKRNGK